MIALTDHCRRRRDKRSFLDEAPCSLSDTANIDGAIDAKLGHTHAWLHPGVLLGVCAGGCTATPALAAVQEAAIGAIPSIGYGVARVLLAFWGTVIVALLK